MVDLSAMQNVAGLYKQIIGTVLLVVGQGEAAEMAETAETAELVEIAEMVKTAKMTTIQQDLYLYIL